MDEGKAGKDEMRFSISEVLLLTSISLIWVIAVALVAGLRLPGRDFMDLAGLLFGAASVALFMLSFFVAILAIFGWQSLRDTIKERAEAAVRPHAEELSKKITFLGDELEARLKSALGYLVAELGRDWDKIEPLQKDRIEYAVELCQEAYSLLKGMNSEHALGAENNLIFYSALLKPAEGGHLLKQAREIFTKGEELQRQHYILTYCRIALQYSTDQEEKQKVRRILKDIEEKGKLLYRKEASLYLTSFPEP